MTTLTNEQLSSFEADAAFALDCNHLFEIDPQDFLIISKALRAFRKAGYLAAIGRIMGREECAKLIEEYEEAVATRDNTRFLQPRTLGNQLGMAFVAAIRAMNEETNP